MNQKSRQVQEILKCGKDPLYFINKYVKIQHVTKGTIPFKTFDYQDDCIKDFIDHRFNIVLKARQLGMSTLVAGYSVWLTLFQKDKRVLIIATKLSVAQNIIQKVKTAINSLPKWLVLPEIVTNNKQSIEFSTGSSIKAIPTSDDAGRSESLSLLIVDEAAFVKNFDSLWTALYPTVSTGGRVILLSTPNGVGGQYYKLYTQSEAGENEFNNIKLMWDVHPDYDQEWFDRTSKNMSKKQVAQELLCDFQSSGATFINNADFEWMMTMVKEPINKEGESRNVWVWEYPKFGNKYLISGDVARGDSKDFSAFHVFDTSSLECVAEFKGKVPPDVFAEIICDYGARYNDAILCPENNNYGYATLMKMKELKYPNVYIMPKKRSTVFYPGSYNVEDSGFNTNSGTRNKILTKLEELIRTRKLTFRSSRFYEECKRFVWRGNRAQAMKGFNDDLVMSAAIGAWLLDTEYATQSQSDDFHSAMLKAMSVNRNMYDAGEVSGYNKGIPKILDSDRSKTKYNSESKTKAIIDPDHMWLFK